MSTYTGKTIRMAPYLIACSMQHVSTVLTYPGSCKTCFSRIPVFGRNFLLIFAIIYQITDLHNWPAWPYYPPWSLLTSTLDGDFQHACIDNVDIPQISSLFDQFALKFHWVKTCFGCIDSVYIEITYIYLIWSCLNQSLWWLCMRHTRSTTP